eukprot:8521236-Prorocentrum_lima.AAC.1
MTSSLVGSEMCIRDSSLLIEMAGVSCGANKWPRVFRLARAPPEAKTCTCLLYTSDAADDM